MMNMIAGLENLLRVAASVMALAPVLMPITATASAAPSTGDDRFMAVAAKLPGFAGMYVDAATDTLYVYSVGAANEAMTTQVIAEALGPIYARRNNTH
jgi:hypothetical protein